MSLAPFPGSFFPWPPKCPKTPRFIVRYGSKPYLGRPYLVGAISTPLKNMLVSWDDEIPNVMGKS